MTNFDYLDYLEDHTYAELPTEVRSTISEMEYTAARRVALEIATPTLPASLQLAFREQVSPKPPRLTENATSSVSWWPTVLALGLGFLLGYVVWGWADARPDQPTLRPEPIVERVIVRDTLLTAADTVYRERVMVKFREVTVRDTVWRSQPPRIIYLPDTTVVAELPVGSLSGSSSLAGREGLLDLLEGVE